MPNFIKGTSDPTLIPDIGAGNWKSKSKTADMIALKTLIQSKYHYAYVLVGSDATKHLAHYFGNTGSDYTIDLKGMIDQVPSAKRLYLQELNDAKLDFAGVSPGEHIFTSSRTRNGYNDKNENRNWFFAIGGYSVWSKGRVVISRSPGGKKGFYMEFEYKFFDRYNWDKGKSVELYDVKITDEFMGEFHRQGLAREYNCYGSVKDIITWGDISIIDKSLLKNASSVKSGR